MALRPFFFILLLLLAAAVSPASAVEEIHIEDSTSYSLSAPDDLCISGFDADSILPDFNYSAVMNSYGDMYTLNITGTKNWYGRWNFNVSMTDPNGTTTSKHLSTVALAARTCDISVQYAFTNTAPLEWANVDLYVGLLPLRASFTNLLSADPNSTLAGVFDDELYYTRLMFSNLTYACDSPADLTIYCSTEEEFQQQVKESISAYAKELSGDFFTWSWNAILRFVSMIPFIGDDLVTAILIASYIIDEIFFYFNLFFIQYVETTILTLEFFIVTYSLHRTKTRSPVKLVKNVVSDHIAVFEFIIEKARFAIDLLIRIVHAIASIVQSLKPI